MTSEKKKRASGPSGPSKSHTEREASGQRHIGVWVAASIREQLDKLATVDGSITQAVAAAISERFQRVFGVSKRK